MILSEVISAVFSLTHRVTQGTGKKYLWTCKLTLLTLNLISTSQNVLHSTRAQALQTMALTVEDNVRSHTSNLAGQMR